MHPEHLYETNTVLMSQCRKPDLRVIIRIGVETDHRQQYTVVDRHISIVRVRIIRVRSIGAVGTMTSSSIYCLLG